jgi:hypothetical protein
MISGMSNTHNTIKYAHAMPIIPLHMPMIIEAPPTINPVIRRGIKKGSFLCARRYIPKALTNK